VVPALAHLRPREETIIDPSTVLVQIEQHLAAGLATDWATRAYTDVAIHVVRERLSQLPPNDLQARLVVAGFTLAPFVPDGDADDIEQSCATCMYFDAHRPWCDLPELMLPVRAEWSCILWRI